MDRKIAFVFSSPPHGTTSGREGLDAVLATSSLTERIALFFVSDGVFQLIEGQNPQMVLARNYISTFKVLPLYDVKTFWVCDISLHERGLSVAVPMVLDTVVISPDQLRKELVKYDTVLNF